MMPRTLSVLQLYEDHLESLNLSWEAAVGADRFIELKDREVFGPDVVGHMNLIYSHRVQVLGHAERRWYDRVGPERYIKQIEELIAAEPPALIVADGHAVLPEAKALCEKTQTPLFSTPNSCAEVIDILHLYLAKRFADATSLHGVFLDVFGIGVLIMGESGIGKSELALELISRGHGLIADDIVELARVSPTSIEGRAPAILRDYLEVRGLGILNIRTIFGETASRRKMRLKLIVQLQRVRRKDDEPPPRLPENESHDVLGVRLPRVVFNVAPGRNLAVLVEAAVRNTILHLRGIDSTEEFINRQQVAVLDETL